MMIIRKEFTFEASHVLPNHDGKCRNLHGHSYKVEVFARGDVRPRDGGSDEGMVIDFGVISRAWRDYIEPDVDHRHLNDMEGLSLPTAENIAEYLLRRFQRLIPHAGVYRLRVWEGYKSYAEAGDLWGAMCQPGPR